MGLLAAVSGCGPNVVKRTCMGGADDNPLVTDAAMVRLDVYGSGGHCADGQLLAGSGTPILSRTYGPGQAINLDVPPGPHALVLTTFSDSDGVQMLGVGCTEADLQAGSQICFDLTIGPAPDGGDDLSAGNPGGCSIAPDSCPVGQYCTTSGCVGGCKNNPDCVSASKADGGSVGANICDPGTRQCVECIAQSDCALGNVCTPSHVCAPGCDVAAGKLCPGSLTCCNNTCIDTNTDKLNCGGCGTTCSTTNANVTQCTGGTCGWNCNSGWQHCSAGNTGCDTNVFNVNHCGACNNVCDQTNSIGAACPAGSCTYTSCKSGYADCNTSGGNVNGCETHTDADSANCGACGRACNNSHTAALHCTAGVCDSTCSSGYGNCSQPPAGPTAPYAADDGCESNINTCTATACCSMNMPTPANMCAPPAGHSNGIGSQAAGWGLGEMYADCHALGVPDNAATYTSQMANEAMAAAPGTASPSAMCGNANCVWKAVAGLCVVWCYTNDTTTGGSNIAGHVYQNDLAHSPGGTCNGTKPSNTPLCPLQSDPTWN